MNCSNPLISCICITSNRPITLQRALACFQRQDYPNTELVISYPEDDLLTKAVIDQIESSSIIRLIRIIHPKEEQLMLTKNTAINAAGGDFICIWNSDHWHHVNRISDQYRVLKNSPFRSSTLMHILLFDFKNQQTFYSAYRNWEETLLCEKQILLQAIYMDIERTNDHPVLHFLSAKNLLYHISESPHLYIYVYYHHNRFDEAHYQNCFFQSVLLEDINETVQDVVNMDYYLLGGLKSQSRFWDI
ncbi:glycosyltransferase family A protein [Pedobacter steynii]|uniref:Glycosyltransferase 2-like domain-containing protein n=1 Tax=Pedobacter steynii TaxID=430522 RepID=A0A1D7QBI4_9SPHI|nr:glycosyltransferase family A protein [Pedobacter steynii]AOM76058.1 hypothetical protein BFS30_02080 [Pedobacter steynii]